MFLLMIVIIERFVFILIGEMIFMFILYLNFFFICLCVLFVIVGWIVKFMECFDEFCVIRIMLIFVVVREENRWLVMFGILKSLLFDKVSSVMWLMEEIFFMVCLFGFVWLEISVFLKDGLKVFLM